MTETPEVDDLLGQRLVWIVCTAPGEESCTNHIPGDPRDDDGEQTEYIASWGTATAAFGEIDAYRVYGKRVSALLIERELNPEYIEEGEPGYDPDIPRIIERVVPTYTQEIRISTPTPELITPAIELYDGIPENGEQSVCGIIDGTYYIYPVVFPEAKLCYLERCSGVYDDFKGEICSSDIGLPLEPYKPECDPPVYPMDAITQWVPSDRVEETIEYNATWEYYNLEEDPDRNNLLSAGLKLNMTVYAPSADWATLLNSYQKLTYFYNGIYH